MKGLAVVVVVAGRWYKYVWQTDRPRTAHAWWSARATQPSQRENPHSSVTGRASKERQTGQI